MHSFTHNFRNMFVPAAPNAKARYGGKHRNHRISETTVRVTLGNEITDYHLDYREGENVMEMDFNGWTPLHKYFGRFREDGFTGIKYNYGYALGKEKVGKYVESIMEYRNGKIVGEQVYFNTEGDVVRRIHIRSEQLTEQLHPLTA